MQVNNCVMGAKPIKYDISDPTLVDLSSTFFVPYTNMKNEIYSENSL